MLKKIVSNLLILFEGIIRNISGTLGLKIRYFYYSLRLKSLGKDSAISLGVVFINPEKISIGQNTKIDEYCMVIAGDAELKDNKEEKYLKNEKFKGGRGDVIIKDNVHIAPFCIINGFGSGVEINNDVTLAASSKVYSCTNYLKSFSTDKDSSMSPRSKTRIIPYLKKEVVIEENSFVSINSIVLCCTLGKNSVLKPNSFLNNDFGENLILSGNPAEVEKKR